LFSFPPPALFNRQVDASEFGACQDGARAEAFQFPGGFKPSSGDFKPTRRNRVTQYLPGKWIGKGELAVFCFSGRACHDHFIVLPSGSVAGLSRVLPREGRERPEASLVI